MAITVFSVAQVFAPLQGFLARLAPQARQRPPRADGIRPAVVRTRTAHAPRAAALMQCRKADRPLRVFKVRDEAAPPAAARLVLSGTMRDVCEELDRLAAMEAATH